MGNDSATAASNSGTGSAQADARMTVQWQHERGYAVAEYACDK